MNTAEWLTGWKLRTVWEPKPPYGLYNKECQAMVEIGQSLFGSGVMPPLKGLVISEIHQQGTSGNFAVRHVKVPNIFVVTRRGAHKGNLQKDDFTAVHYVNWPAKEIYVHLPNPDVQPSTDSLLVAKAFELEPSINIWLHFHRAVTTPYSIKINYPAIEDSDWNKFETLVKSGARVINLIDHDLLRKGQPNNEPDSAIILGGDIERTFQLARRLINETR